jgi:hypothetical protein
MTLDLTGLGTTFVASSRARRIVMLDAPRKRYPMVSGLVAPVFVTQHIHSHTSLIAVDSSGPKIPHSSCRKHSCCQQTQKPSHENARPKVSGSLRRVQSSPACLAKRPPHNSSDDAPSFWRLIRSSACTNHCPVCFKLVSCFKPASCARADC